MIEVHVHQEGRDPLGDDHRRIHDPGDGAEPPKADAPKAEGSWIARYDELYLRRDEHELPDAGPHVEHPACAGARKELRGAPGDGHRGPEPSRDAPHLGRVHGVEGDVVVEAEHRHDEPASRSS